MCGASSSRITSADRLEWRARVWRVAVFVGALWVVAVAAPVGSLARGSAGQSSLVGMGPALGGRRRGRAALLAVLALLGVGAARARADTFSGRCDACSATYGGTFTEHDVQPGGQAPDGSQYEVTTDITITWSENVVNNGNFTATAQQPTLSGTYKTTDTEPGVQGSDCTVSLNPHSPAAVSWSYISSPADSHYDITAGPPAGVLSGSGPCNGQLDPNPAQDPQAGNSPWSGMGCHWGSDGGLILTLPTGGPYSVPDSCAIQSSSSNGATVDDTVTDHLNWTSARSSTGPGGPGTQPGTPGPQLTPAKNQARGDLIRTLNRSAVYCVGYASGAGLAGTGILLSGIGGGIGLTFTVAGGLVTAALNPLCGPAIERMILDYETFNDPPLSSIGVIARPLKVRLPKLPACRRHQRSCDSLRSALTALDTAALVAAADVSAIEQTVSREHAAVLAGDQAAVNAQDRNLALLRPKLGAAQRAEASAGRLVAKALRGGHLAFRLSSAQSRRQRSRIEQAVARGGVTAQQVTAIDPTAFKSGKANLLAVLGG
jgi:hypothetical protein